MSTILDALKKSEQERKLNDLPTLSDMPAPKERSQWPQIIIISLLALLLIVFLLLLSRGWNSSPSSETKSAKSIVLNNETIASIDSSDASSDQSIKVNVVSYSENSEQRFAMINGKMTREGEFGKSWFKGSVNKTEFRGADRARSSCRVIAVIKTASFYFNRHSNPALVIIRRH